MRTGENRVTRNVKGYKWNKKKTYIKYHLINCKFLSYFYNERPNNGRERKKGKIGQTDTSKQRDGQASRQTEARL